MVSTQKTLGKWLWKWTLFCLLLHLGLCSFWRDITLTPKEKKCVVIGRSRIVGRPMSILMSAKGTDATVTLIHSHTPNIEEYTQKADIVIVALGIPNYLKGDMIKRRCRGL